MADIVITPLSPRDRDRWAELWRGYLDFYKTRLPPEIYEHTWRRLTAADRPIHGLGARLGSTTAPLVGIVHYLFHAHAWTTQEVCYLQDLFVDRALRRSGCGRRLIEAVAAAPRPVNVVVLGSTGRRKRITRSHDRSTTRSPGSMVLSATTTR